MRKYVLIILSLFIMAVNAFADSSTYLNFTAVNGFVSIKLQQVGNPYSIGLKYSTDSCSTWTTYTINQIIYIPSGSTVYFKALFTNPIFSNSRLNYYKFSMFSTGGYIVADGNIMSLLDETMTQTSVPSNAFYSLFSGCTLLTTAPYLPATTLADSCYLKMFQGCTSLLQAPSLPATTLHKACYYAMFDSCISLTQAPVLPATTLVDFCYSSMFSCCISLAQAPALPATILTDYCYAGMFYGCSSLTQPPALPATILTDNCYSGMFQGCTSLTQTPALPATILTDNCYASMFQGCTSLAQPPALPATSLAQFCYSQMFADCTSLTQAPVLPATTLVSACYQCMFENCSSMIVNTTRPGKVWRIPSNAIMDGSYNHWNFRMFSGTGGSFTGQPVVGIEYYFQTSGNICTVQVNSNDTIGGSVSGGGKYDSDSSVTITATPSEHYHFVRWSNGVTIPSFALTVDSDTTLTAFFAIDQCVVTLTSNDPTMGSATGGGTFDYGQTVTLTATPTAHYHFVNWSNGQTTPTITITVDTDTTLTATFAINKHTVTVNSNDAKMGDVTGSGIFDYGQTVTLTATANEHYHFLSWSNGMTSTTITIIVLSDTTLTATFEADVYNVTAIANYASRGTVTGSGQYSYLDRATLTAMPNQGYIFTGWSNGETNQTIYITVECDTAITAIFEEETTAVDDVEEGRNIIIAPNPVKVGETICIKGDFTDEEKDGMVVEILSTDGTLVNRTSISTTPIELDGINSVGTYIVRITTGTGKVYVEKLMVK